MFRQGDLLIIAVDHIPTNVKAHKRGKQPIVLALGETTGHKHMVKELEVKWFGKTDDTVQYIRSANPFAVVHEEHDTLQLPPGAYAVIRQVQYTPAELQVVRD